MILYIENPKNATRKLLELTNEYSKIAGCKSNMQKSMVLLYTTNEKSVREIRGGNPIYHCKKNKTPRNKPT